MAEDITHDCFLSLIRKPGNFVPGRASLRTYLFSAARNLWLKQLTNTGRELAIDDFEDEQFVAVSRQPLRRVLDNELSLKVEKPSQVCRLCNGRPWSFLSMKVSL